MAASRPKRLRFKNITQGKKLPLGDPVKLDFDGDYRNPAGSRFVHVMIRVAYRVNGVPHTQIIYSKEAVQTAANSPDFKQTEADTPTDPIATYTPQVAGVHTFRLIAWDLEELAT